MAHPLLEHAEYLHTQGTKLLLESGVSKILERYGAIEIGGSYLYRLMSHPDIDIAI